MMKTITKHRLLPDVRDPQIVRLPRLAKAIGVIASFSEEQGLTLDLYALANPGNALCDRRFVVTTTEWFDASRAKYVGTASLREGQFVYHVLEWV